MPSRAHRLRFLRSWCSRIRGPILVLAISLSPRTVLSTPIDYVPCPGTEVTPPPTSPPPYCLPLQIHGRWSAVPQCYNLWPPEESPPLTDCKDSAGDVNWDLNMFPRGLYSVHAALTYEGKVAIWKQTYGLSQTSQYVPRMFYADPNDFSTFTHESIQAIPNDATGTGSSKDLFCSGHVVMPDGRVLAVGGTDHDQGSLDGDTAGSDESFLLDPVAKSWAHAGSMEGSDLGRRWYPTATLLPDGKVLAVSGTRRNIFLPQNRLSQTPEVFKLGAGWTTQPSAAFASNWMTLYPYMHLIPGPGTRVLHEGPYYPQNQFTVLGGLDGSSSPIWTNALPVGSLLGGGSVMYEVRRTGVKILRSGGPQEVKSPDTEPLSYPDFVWRDPAVAGTEKLEVDATSGAITRTTLSPMSTPRFYHNLSVLADGTVLATGGSRYVQSSGSQACHGVYITEIWDPSSESWTARQPMIGLRTYLQGSVTKYFNTPRMYHSVSLLLPDGRVLLTGGVADSGCNVPYERIVDISPPKPPIPVCLSADVYEPPYLFVGDIPLSPYDRPELGVVPTHLAYGEDLTFHVIWSGRPFNGGYYVHKVALVRPSSVTHSNDMDQRYLPFTNPSDYFSPWASGWITIWSNKLPTPKLAPPGYYMLFIMNGHMNPSIAKFVNLWGIVEESVSVVATLSCDAPTIKLTIRFDTTIWPDTDRIEVFAPQASGLCPPPGSPTWVFDGSPQAPAGAPAQPNNRSHYYQYSGSCLPGNWKVVIKSRKSTSTSTAACRTVSVPNCLTCPPPCSLSCELE